MTPLLADVVAREPLAAADGRSGSLLERVTLANGRTLVVKHVLDGGDWIMRGCHDHGRAAQLWSQGVLARVPAVIDHAVVGAEEVEGGWVVVMRDLSAALLPDHARITRDDSRRVLRAGPRSPGRLVGRRHDRPTRAGRGAGYLLDVLENFSAHGLQVPASSGTWSSRPAPAWSSW
jgi:hypothetical protein